METKLSENQRKVCFNTKKHLTTARVSLYVVPLPFFIFAFGVIKFRLFFPKGDFAQFIVFGLVCSMLVGLSFSTFSLMPIIEKLFKAHEDNYEVEGSKNLNEKEMNICRNSRRNFVRSIWLSVGFLMLTVSGALLLIQFRFYFRTVEFLLIYIALVACSILEGWYIGVLRYSPILTKLFNPKREDEA